MAVDPIKQGFPIQLRHDPARLDIRFVGNDKQAASFLLQCRRRFRHTGIGAAVTQAIPVIPFQKGRQQMIHPLRRSRRAQGPFHQLTGAVSHHQGIFVKRMDRIPRLRQGAVGGLRLDPGESPPAFHQVKHHGLWG